VAERSGIPCVIYAAKSTEDRRGSIPGQLEELRETIGQDERRRLVAEYTDEAFSAFKRDRGPGLLDATQHAEDLLPSTGWRSCGRSIPTGSPAATAGERGIRWRWRCGRSNTT